MNDKSFRLLILFVLVAVAFYLVFSVWAGWQNVVRSFVAIGFGGGLVSISLSLVNYLLRYFRWQLFLLQLGYRIPYWESLKIYLSGFALTTTPGKAGELFRGGLLKKYGMPFSTSVSAFLSERLSDLIAMVLLTLLALSEFPQYRIYVFSSALICFIAYAGLSSGKLLSSVSNHVAKRSGYIYSLIGHFVSIMLDARKCHTPKLLAFATPISVIAWGAEAFALFYILQILGVEASLTFAVFVYSISMLAGAISFLPGGLGTAEIVMASLLSLRGMPLPEAIAVTVFVRLATLWFAVVLGLFALCSFTRGGANEIRV